MLLLAHAVLTDTDTGRSQLEKTGKLEGISTGVSLNKIFVHNDEMLEGLTKRTSAVQG